MPLPTSVGRGSFGHPGDLQPQHLSASQHGVSLQKSRVRRPTKEADKHSISNKMATQEGFPSEVQKVASDLRISYPELLSSLDQQQQLRRLVNDRKSKAFLCAVITLTGEQPNGYAAGSDGTALTIADLMSQATAAILALESAHSPSRQNVALSLTPARGDGPGAFTAGGNAPAQSSAPGGDVPSNSTTAAVPW